MILIVDVERGINRQWGDSEAAQEYCRSQGIEARLTTAMRIDTNTMIAQVFQIATDEAGEIVADEQLGVPKRREPFTVHLRALPDRWEALEHETLTGGM